MNDVFITYRHFRLFDNIGETKPKGGATLAFFVDLRDPDNRYAIVGYALCSDKDHFSKTIGREVAYQNLNFTRRLLKNGWNMDDYETSKFVVTPKNDGGTLCTQLLTHLDTTYDTIEDYDGIYALSRWMRKHLII